MFVAQSSNLPQVLSCIEEEMCVGVRGFYVLTNFTIHFTLYTTNLLHHEQVYLMFNERYSSLWRETSSITGPD